MKAFNLSRFVLLLLFLFSSIQLLMADKQLDLIVESYNEKIEKLSKSYTSKKSKYKDEILKKLEALKKQKMQKGDLDSANTVQKKIRRLQGEHFDRSHAGNTSDGMDFAATPPPPGTPPVSKKDIRKYKKVKTPEDIHKALKALNPVYQGNGKCEIEDGQIVEIDLNSCNIVNIAPLAGLKYVHSINLSDNPLWDLSPIKNLNLTGLSLGRTDVRNIDVLKGMKLYWLDVSYTKIQDISVLKKMPLHSLELHGCIFIRDFSPLAKSKELEKLILPLQAKDMDISALKKLKKLQYIDTEWKEDNKKKTATQFWKELRAR